jgi:hypothetical protein
MRKICFVILLVPALAWAQPKSAEEWYKEGENQYLLGNFDKAVEAFKQGFSLETDDGKRAAYLYNVAQSYRQANDCSHALFFYKRFLALKDANPTKPLTPKQRKEVGDWIAELETCVQQQASVSKRPPNTNLPPDGDPNDKNPPATGDTGRKDPGKTPGAGGDVASTDTGPGGDDDDRGEPDTTLRAGVGPRMLSARFNIGATKVSAGMFKVPVQATFALVGGYPIRINERLVVEAGIAATLTPVPYDRTRTGMAAQSRTALLTGVMANGGVTYEVAPRIGVRGDLGLGGLFFSNVSESQFTNQAMTSGALSMFHLRIAASADYAFTPNVVGTVTPIAFTFSPPKTGLDDSIKRITSIDFMLGIAYRM